MGDANRGPWLCAYSMSTSSAAGRLQRRRHHDVDKWLAVCLLLLLVPPPAGADEHQLAGAVPPEVEAGAERSPSDLPLPAAPDEPSSPEQPQSDCPEHELWQVNTRHLGSCCMPPPLRVYQWQDCQWQSRAVDDLVAPFDGLLVIFVHGNRMEPGNTLDRGRLYYRCLTGGACRPVRFVIWSWPSERIKGQIRDVRVKARRADCEGAYLAWLHGQTAPGQPVSMIGYSYGNRVIASALNRRARGRVGELELPPGEPVRVVMTAAAMSDDALHPGRDYGCALSQIDQLLVIYNSKDPILKRYHVVEKGSHPEALGYAGMCCPLPEVDQIRQINAQRIIGRSHYEPRYLHNGYLRGQMQQYVLWR